ncbi:MULTISPECIES: hypothetical protein [unclassified Pantoea]|uniref:hypothetical protein n=1 Tax=unclassified Pantoea TaxID=2630326 RepID=UPI0028B02812|nr:hypothetical protein [Pantoea sp.]
MKIDYITNGVRSILSIKSFILCLSEHIRVVEAALEAAPEADVTTNGIIILRTLIAGDPVSIFAALTAARREEEY